MCVPGKFPLQFDSGVVGSELPVDANLPSISVGLRSSDERRVVVERERDCVAFRREDLGLTRCVSSVPDIW